jgi:hypothetical protein
MVKEWEAPLKEPVYDLLSLFYNFRPGALGALSGGATLRVAILPTPEPQELLCRIGPETGQGRKVMVNWHPPGAFAEEPCFIFPDPEQVPTLAWTRVSFFCKLGGRLLNPGDIRKNGLITPYSPGTSSPVGRQGSEP